MVVWTLLLFQCFQQFKQSHKNLQQFLLHQQNQTQCPNLTQKQTTKRCHRHQNRQKLQLSRDQNFFKKIDEVRLKYVIMTHNLWLIQINYLDSSSLSPRSFARNARSKKDSSPAEDEVEDFIILDDDIEDEPEDVPPEEVRRYSSDRSSDKPRSLPEATTADLYDDLVPIDIDAMPDNTPYDTRDSRMEYQEAQM